MLVESLALARRLGDARLEVRARTLLGMLATYECEYAAARAHYQPALEFARASGDRGSLARLLNNLGDTWAYQGEPRTARPYYEESVALERELGNQQMTSNVVGSLGAVLVELGELSQARRMLRESVELVRALGIRYSLPTALEQVAALATAAGQPLEAARLWGAAEAMRRRIEAPLERFAEPQLSAAIARARTLIDAPSFDAAWRSGARLPPEEAADLALAEGLGIPGARPARTERATDRAGEEDVEPLDPRLS
jgi:Tfp pilus assembly protein PilF